MIKMMIIMQRHNAISFLIGEKLSTHRKKNLNLGNDNA